MYNLEHLEKPIFSKTIKESELINHWVNSKFESAVVKKELYQKYCPVCRSTNLDSNNNLYHCENCGTEYVFKDVDEVQDVIWFVKVRRV